MNDETTSPATTAAATTAATPESGEAQAITEERVREELKNVIDPEIGLDMVSLGLLYGVTIEGSAVKVLMTLTSPACPVGPMFVAAVKAAVLNMPSVTSCDVDLTFSPPWDPRTMASDEVKLQMGFYY